jgi:hypothetical protein
MQKAQKKTYDSNQNRKENTNLPSHDTQQTATITKTSRKTLNPRNPEHNILEQRWEVPLASPKTRQVKVEKKKNCN